ncbi:MAG: sulfatase-like hydrolase/transferase, partial [Verrucomicrobiota bacterium]
MKKRTIILLLACFCSGMASGSDWQRNGENLLCNFNNMYNPCVVETGGEYRFKMWFFGWATSTGNPDVPGYDAIFLARSKDLKTWEVHCKDGSWDTAMNPAKWFPVLHADERWYGTCHIGDPSVVLKDGRYYMAYSSTSDPFAEAVEGYPVQMAQCVMGAVSDDGIHWSKSDQPLLIRAEDRLPPEPAPGRIGDFHRPCLRWENNRWRLWFDYWLPGEGVCMGYAENEGDFLKSAGFKIKHDLKKPVLANWPNPEIIRIGDTYHAFGDPAGYTVKEGQSHWMERQLCEAVSPDGLNWKRLDFIPPDEDTDASHVPQALVAEIDGKEWLYLFYATQSGYRKNDGKYHYQYDRIRAMRRPVNAGKPNIIVIFTDDQGYADVGVHGQVTDIKTPNLDSLARDGVVCTSGYITAPQCSPSRAGLLTGKYQQRFGFDHIPNGPLRLEETTIAERLKAAGYATGM